jgi:hypothetical protein
MSVSYQCYTCKHYLSPNICDAFPEGGLPDSIFTGEVIHDHSIPGDHGIRWEPWDEAGRRHADFPLPSSLDVECPAPIPWNGRTHGDLIPFEESASLWMWAWPELLGWRRPVTWLFSPVVGYRKYPGDLWGLDSDGELLIVETKFDRHRRAQNPFSRFFPYWSDPNTRELWPAEALKAHWTDLYKKELKFFREYARHLSPLVPIAGTHPGVLPYSSHRGAIWRWQDLYLSHVAPLFRDDRYKRAVEECLRRREALVNQKPRFVGLIATVHPWGPKLSTAGRKDLGDLRAAVGTDHVYLRAVQAERCTGTEIRIHAWTPTRTGRRGPDAPE